MTISWSWTADAFGCECAVFGRVVPSATAPGAGRLDPVGSPGGAALSPPDDRCSSLDLRQWCSVDRLVSLEPLRGCSLDVVSWMPPTACGAADSLRDSAHAIAASAPGSSSETRPAPSGRLAACDGLPRNPPSLCAPSSPFAHRADGAHAMSSSLSIECRRRRRNTCIPLYSTNAAPRSSFAESAFGGAPSSATSPSSSMWRMRRSAAGMTTPSRASSRCLLRWARRRKNARRRSAAPRRSALPATVPTTTAATQAP